MNAMINIIKEKNSKKAIQSHAEAIDCLKIIQSNFHQTKNELHEIGLLGQRIEIKNIAILELDHA